MKDTKPKVTIVTNNIHTTHYANGEYDIDLVFPPVKWAFKFNKFNRIKELHNIRNPQSKPITSYASNWWSFRELLKDAEKQGGEAPTWIKRLAIWRFDKPVGVRLVEDQIGCVIFFKKEEY